MRFLIIFFVFYVWCFAVHAAAPANNSPGDSLRYKTNPNYDYELNMYRIYKKKRAAIVMLGNSITHGVNWNELLGRDDIVDRGIPGDNLDGILARMQTVLDLKPRIVFIMAGINDIYNWTPVPDIMRRYIEVVDILRKNKITVVVQSTLFVAPSYQSSADRNLEVSKLNDSLMVYCKSQQIEFINLNLRLSGSKSLKPEMAYDGLHLNANGYKLWGQEVERVLFRVYP